MHDLFGNLLPFVIGGVFALAKWRYDAAKRAQRRTAESIATAAPVAQASPQPRIAVRPRKPKPERSRMDRTPPADAASAQPADLRPRPDTTTAPVAPAAAPARVGIVAAGRAWAANAIVAAEVFGPPVALRAGGTLRPPGAF